MEKTNYVIWSGEGLRGTSYIVRVKSLRGLKRILTKERCNDDRWAFASKYIVEEFAGIKISTRQNIGIAKRYSIDL